MDHYVDIYLLPDPEWSPAHLMNTLFGKLHLALAQRDGDIGISFPDVKGEPPWLGERLRLHGAAAALKELLLQPWFSGMRDYLRWEGVEQVPAGAAHRTVSRVQTKSSAERLRRRQMRRHGLTAEDALRRIPASVERHLELPYVTIQSSSNAQRFRLFIRHGAIQTEPRAGRFTAYGLSSDATVPWF